MSEWDFLWELGDEEREFAISTGLTYDDLRYLEEQEEKERKKIERQRIKIRNKAWRELKELRDKGLISHDDFKKRKCEIFSVEIQQKEQRKAVIKELRALHEYSVNNRNTFSKSIKCLCYGCVSTILVYNLSYDDNTAICPKCHRKAIIPFSEWGSLRLKLMHDYYYPDDKLQKHDY